MTNLIKTAARILTAVALCAAVSACSPSVSNGSFPAYGSQNSVSSASVSTPVSIMDY